MSSGSSGLRMTSPDSSLEEMPFLMSFIGVAGEKVGWKVWVVIVRVEQE